MIPHGSAHEQTAGLWRNLLLEGRIGLEHATSGLKARFIHGRGDIDARSGWYFGLFVLGCFLARFALQTHSIQRIEKEKIEQHHSFDFYKFSPEVEECSFEHQPNSIQIEESTSCGGMDSNLVYRMQTKQQEYSLIPHN